MREIKGRPDEYTGTPLVIIGIVRASIELLIQLFFWGAFLINGVVMHIERVAFDHFVPCRPASVHSPGMTMIQQKSDAELVGEYARTRSDPAFEAIVQRHVNAVYAAAWRQVRDAPLAEDITQAVFIVLAKRAHRIHDPRLLAGWLLKVTRYCAADARKLAARREFHEQRAAAMKPTISEGNAMEPDIAEHLDAHLTALGAVDRAAIVLRCLEERPLAEVARELQMSEEAAKKRVARALEKLRTLFVRKGRDPVGGGSRRGRIGEAIDGAARRHWQRTICTAAAVAQ